MILAIGVFPTLFFFRLGAIVFLSGVITGVLASEVQAVYYKLIFSCCSRVCVSLNVRLVSTGQGSFYAEFFLMELVICNEVVLEAV